MSRGAFSASCDFDPDDDGLFVDRMPEKIVT
jgi:hypothetical protein